MDFKVSSYNMIALLKLELACSSQDRLPMRNEAGMSLAAVQPQALKLAQYKLCSQNTHICRGSPVLKLWNWQSRFCESQVYQILSLWTSCSHPPHIVFLSFVRY